MARTLLLDLDGTLVDTVPDLASALNRLMSARGLPTFEHRQVAPMVGDGVAVLVTRAFAAHDRTADADAIAEFAADYSSHSVVDSKLYPGVLPALSGLAEGGWRLAVCTNKPEAAARGLLQALQLSPLLCAVGGGDSFTRRKPDPAHLLNTLAHAGGTTDATVMLGDHRNDIIAARAAGIKSIFAGWGYGAVAMADGCTAIAADFTDAAAIANRLLPLPD